MEDDGQEVLQTFRVFIDMETQTDISVDLGKFKECIRDEVIAILKPDFNKHIETSLNSLNDRLLKTNRAMSKLDNRTLNFQKSVEAESNAFRARLN